jgi:hypothetical protein
MSNVCTAGLLYVRPTSNQRVSNESQMAPRKIQRSPLGVWTEQSSQEFYRSIQALGKQLKTGQSPQKPKDYSNVIIPKSTGYLLSFEEELLLADHFAFIAHAIDDNRYVSAATIEESKDASTYTVRLASNRTLKKNVQDGLARIVEIIMKHAETGKSNSLNRVAYPDV